MSVSTGVRPTSRRASMTPRRRSRYPDLVCHVECFLTSSSLSDLCHLLPRASSSRSVTGNPSSRGYGPDSPSHVGFLYYSPPSASSFFFFFSPLSRMVYNQGLLLLLLPQRSIKTIAERIVCRKERQKGGGVGSKII